MSCWLYVDGNKVDKYTVQERSERTIRGLRVSQDRRRPFVFAPLKTTGMSQRYHADCGSFAHFCPDDEAALFPSTNALAELGTIRVDCFRADESRRLTWGGAPSGRKLLEHPEAIHERTKKAGAHRVQCVRLLLRMHLHTECMYRLGEVHQTHTAAQRISVTYLDPPKDGPYLRFVFRYRPLGALHSKWFNLDTSDNVG